MPHWAFLTNHARVLLCIAQDQTARIRDIAACIGIGERATAGIVKDLCEAGYLTKHRVGRRNRYEVHAELPLRGSLERDHRLEEVLRPLIARESKGASQGSAAE